MITGAFIICVGIFLGWNAKASQARQDDDER